MEQSGPANWQTRVASFQLEEDFIAPDPVTDLAAEASTTNAVWLQWTATADNRSETDEYDIRYSLSPITPENWENATQVTNPPEPNQPGATQQFYISGLEFNQQYYFAMKVTDRQNNYSDLSNVASATTPGEPDIVASTDTIKKTLHQTLSSSEEYSVSNQGESDIRFTTTKNDDITHNAGEILKTYDSEVSGILGIQAVDEKFYLVNSSDQQLLVYDTVTGTIVDTAILHEEPFGITYDGEHLWIGSKQGLIKAYTLQGDSTELYIDIGAENFHALTYNGEFLLVNEVNKDEPIIKAFDTEGNYVRNYQTQIGFDIWQSTWVEQHQSGKLWITNNDGVISQLKLEDGVFTKTQTFEAPSMISYALTHDDSDIVYAEIAEKIHMVDDGVSEVNWLEVTPIRDTIAAQQETILDLKFVSGDLQPGVYSGVMTIHSNDPDEEQIELPLQMTLLEYNPVQVDVTSSADTICEGTQVEFSANISGGEGDYEIEWSSDPAGFEASSDVVTARPEFGTKYYVHVTDGIMDVTDSISLNVKPAPDVTLGPDTSICKNHTLSLTLDEGYESYLWSDGSEGTTLTVDSTNTDNGSNSFWAEVTGNNGCTSADTLVVVQEDCAGVAEIDNVTLNVYPNPTHNTTRLVIDGHWKNLRLSVLNSGGQTLLQRSVEEGKGEKVINIDLTERPAGTYYIQLKVNDKSMTQKILKL
ncbi:MAG: T9SS type A sorting domain-containing protein [Bacteroidales bacterium]|nr:T9SS type A sorting domain-containing protein [Bacteroidales bacterium]